MWEQTGDRIVIFTDTAVTVAETRESSGYQTKVDVLPHLNMAICSTGSVEMASMWRYVINVTPGIDSVDGLAEFAPGILRQLWTDLPSTFEAGLPAQCITNIYHLAIDSEGRAVVYTFGPENDFEPVINRTATQWHVPDLSGNYVPFPTREKAIKLACDIKAEQEQCSHQGENYVMIGGELYMTVLTDGNVTHTRVHEFDDWAGVEHEIVHHRLRRQHDGKFFAEKIA